MNHKLASSLSCCLSLCLCMIGCTTDPPGLGTLRLFVDRTPFAGLEAISFRAERLEVIHSETLDGPTARITIADEPRQVSFLGLAEELPTLIGAFDVPEGFVHQIRLVTAGGTLVIAGRSLAVSVPSGPQTGVKVVPEDGTPFPILTGEVTSVALLLDPEHQLVFLGGTGARRARDVNFKPVIPGRLIEPPGFTLRLPQSLTVRFDPALAARDREAMAAAVGGAITRASSLVDGLVRIRLTDGIDFNGAWAALRASPAVRWATPTFIVAGFQDVIPDDYPQDPWFLDRIGMRAAWGITTGNPKGIAAVLDSGVQLDHPDLFRNVFINEGELPLALTVTDASGRRAADADGDGVITFDDLNDPSRASLLAAAGITDCKQSCPGFVGRGLGDATTDVIDPIDLLAALTDGDSDSNTLADDVVGWNFVTGTNDPDDDSTGTSVLGTPAESHGTAVAGLIAARGDNGIGTSGVGWRTRVIPLKVLDGTLRGVWDRVIEAMHYASGLGAQVLNASFEGLDNTPTASITAGECASAMGEPPLDTRLVVAPAGDRPGDINEADPPLVLVPGMCSSVNTLLVTSVDRDDGKPSGVAFGRGIVHMAAPGVRLLSLDRFGGTNLFTGTSYAAALVSGGASLLASADPFLRAHPARALREQVRFHSQYLASFGAGRWGLSAERLAVLPFIDPPTALLAHELRSPLFTLRTDDDLDGLDDAAEAELGDAFTPLLVFDQDEFPDCIANPSSVLTLLQVSAATHGVTCPTPERPIRIRYLFLYRDDCGEPVFGADSHCGDVEGIELLVCADAGGGRALVVGASYNQHATAGEAARRVVFGDGRVCRESALKDRYQALHRTRRILDTPRLECQAAIQDYNFFATSAGAGFLIDLRIRYRPDGTVHPMVFVSEDKHASYYTRTECNNRFIPPFNIFEDCDPGLTVFATVRDEVNVGESGRPRIIGLDSALFTGAAVFPGEVAWTPPAPPPPSPPPPFCGGQMCAPNDCTSSVRSKLFSTP